MDWTPKDIIEALQEISKLIFGGQIPPIVAAVFGWSLFIGLILGIVWILLFLVSKIIEVSKEKIWPNFYDLDEKRRNLRRRRFAEHIDNEIRFLNRQEAWSDYRFAELEAEVEAEGQRSIFSFLPFIKRTQTGLRREKSLSLALAKSEDRLILLEGEPGAGKSVALRHLTTLLAQRAAKSTNNNTFIPIYVNLKELRKTGAHIDRPQIYDFVLKSLNRVNDRDVEEFLEAEFDKGMQAGTWLFLFDSFDEIPDVLSSTEADATIREYANAISDFLHGMNQCRGVIASRQFRGPGAMGWPKFKVLQLSEKRQLELIKNSGMEPEKENIFSGMLGVASHEIRSMSSNPMFLGLVCDHYKMVNAFPENPHGVFETYINSRFTHDEERIQRRFGLSIKHLRALAESIAFCMAADAGLGLSPTRVAIQGSLDRLKFKYRDLEKTLDALEFMKIARSDVSAPGESQPFTFAHRRFQEYFATSVVLREPERVSARELLLNARWRETAVVVCQTQSELQLNSIYENVANMLNEMVAALKLSFPDIDRVADDLTISKDSVLETKENSKDVKPFLWPKNALHLLGLLQSGFGSQLNKLPEGIRKEAGKIVVLAYKNGTLLDKKWALEVAGCIPSLNLTWIIGRAFRSYSQFLKEVAYRQVAHLGDIPDEIAKSIRLALVGLFLSSRLEREKNATYAHLTRLAQAKHFVAAYKLLRMIRLGDFLLLCVLFLLWVWCSYSQPALKDFWWIFILILVFNYGLSYWFDKNALFRAFSATNDSLMMVLILAILPIFIQWFFILILVPTIPGIKGLIISLTMISLICYVWFPFSLMAVVSGRFLHPFWWPTMALFPIYYFFANIKKIANEVLRFYNDIKFTDFLAVFVTLIFAVFVAVFFSAAINVWVSFVVVILRSIFESINTFVSANFLFFATVGLTPVLYLTILSLYFRIRDEYFFKKYIQEKQFLSAKDFIGPCIGMFSRWTTTNRFIRYIRTTGLLKTDQDDIELLRWFCIFVENMGVRFWRIEHRRMKIDKTMYTIKTNLYYIPAYKKRLTILLSKKIGYKTAQLPAYDSEFLDELYALLEQTSASSIKD